MDDVVILKLVSGAHAIDQRARATPIDNPALYTIHPRTGERRLPPICQPGDEACDTDPSDGEGLNDDEPSGRHAVPSPAALDEPGPRPRAADDFAVIRQALATIKKEASIRHQAEYANGADLDHIARRLDLERKDGEADYALRSRVRELLDEREKPVTQASGPATPPTPPSDDLWLCG